LADTRSNIPFRFDADKRNSIENSDGMLTDTVDLDALESGPKSLVLLHLVKVLKGGPVRMLRQASQPS